MSKITISVSQAQADISQARNQINSQVTALVSQYALLTNGLNESSGEFVTSLKAQIQAEQALVQESISFLLKLCDGLDEAAKNYAEQDRKLSQEIG